MKFFHMSFLALAITMLLANHTFGQCALGVTTLVKVTSSSGAGTYESPALGNIDFEFCFTLDEFFEAQTNWAHGVFISFADLQDGVVYELGSSGEQNTQSGNRKWIYIDSLKARQFNLPGVGFYVDDFDGNPRNNYGDNGKGTPRAKFPDLKPFCIKAHYTCGYPRILRPTITVTGDGTSGGWNNPACPGDKFVSNVGGPKNNGYIVVCGTLLPLDLLSFNGYHSDQSNHLDWTGIADELFSHYELERRHQHEKEFRSLSKFIPANNGQENGMHYFHFTDPELANNISYYRLKMVEKNQSYNYSKVISLAPPQIGSNITKTITYPQPANNSLLISSSAVLRNMEFQILDQTGRSIKSGYLAGPRAQEGQYSLDISSLKSGMYFLKLFKESDSNQHISAKSEFEIIRFIKN